MRRPAPRQVAGAGACTWRIRDALLLMRGPEGLDRACCGTAAVQERAAWLEKETRKEQPMWATQPVKEHRAAYERA